MATASPFRSLPPSPERRLVELLDEKQEPFLLDVYLLENGYVKGSMEAEVTTICWPGRKKACRKLQRFATNGFFSRRQREGIHRSTFPIPLRSKSKGRREETQITESEKVSSSSCSCIKDDRGGALDWEFMDDAKQHSPVSVLEVQSEGGDSPVHEQLSERSTSSWGSKVQSKRPQKTLQQLLMSESNWKKVVSWKPLKWKKHVEELEVTGKLVREQVSEATEEWNRRRQQMTRIEAEIGGAIFDDILRDSVLDFLDLLHRGTIL